MVGIGMDFGSFGVGIDRAAGAAGGFNGTDLFLFTPSTEE
jgi:hypothetical protein